MGPFFVIFMGISLVTVPEAARSLRKSTRHLWRYCILVGIGLTAAAVAWGVILEVALPRGLGALLLHQGKWEAAYSLVPWMVLSMMGATAVAGAMAGLRALGAAKRSMRVNLISTATYVFLGVTGALVHGVYGSVEGTALATWIAAALYWRQLRIGLREYSASLEDQAAPNSTVRPIRVAQGQQNGTKLAANRGRKPSEMSKVPRLSVGLPVYNSSAYVAESIEAILGQTFDGLRSYYFRQRVHR